MEKNNDRKKLASAVFGGGCFWCLDPLFSHVRGVKTVATGYAGGKKENPTYAEVSTGTTGHAEVVKIDYDPAVITYEELLNIFFYVHDPTTLNRQGNDIGPQYRSIILYADEAQRQTAEKVIKELVEKKVYKNPIVTELVKLDKFYRAEEEHQKYFEKNPEKAYCRLVIAPKFEKFKETFKKYYQ